MRWSTYAAGTVVLIGSFLITLWLTQPEMPLGLGTARLANAGVTDQAELAKAADAAGLKPSSYFLAAIYQVTRVTNDQVMIIGWAADRFSEVSPATIMAFVDGKRATQVQTKGERPDVTSALNLKENAASNVGFELQFYCASGRKAFLVATTMDNRYVLLDPVVCP